MVEEAAELTTLLELFEEYFDFPAATLEIALGARIPDCVGGDQDHDPPFLIHFHPGFYPPHFHALVDTSQHDGLILEDGLILGGMIFQRWVFHVVLGTGAPPDPALIIPREMRLTICLKTTNLIPEGFLLFISPLPNGRDFNTTQTHFSRYSYTIL